MNAIALAQREFDNRLPPPVSDSQQEIARAEWIYGAAEMLVRFGYDVKFQRRMRAPQGVTFHQFGLAVDEFVNKRLADCEIPTPSLGYLVIAALSGHADKVASAELLGNSQHPMGKLWEIAESLLEPLADDALKAQAEDADL